LKILLVVNSFASSVTARNTVIVHRRLSRGHDVDVVETNRRGHATRFAHDAARRGVDVVIGFGGDGTLNEVATGIAGPTRRSGCSRADRPTCSPARSACRTTPSSGRAPRERHRRRPICVPIGLGQVNGRYFCFHTGVGFDAAVVERVERHGSLKRWLGHPLFIWAGVSTWLTGYDRRTPHFRLQRRRRPRRRRRLLHDRAQHEPVHLPRQPAARPVTGGHARPALVAITFTTMSAAAILTSLAGALRGGGVKPADHLDIRVDVRTSSSSTRPVPVSGRRRRPRQHQAARVRPRSRCRAVGVPSLTATASH
jgi:hypothetical protein